MTAITLRNLRTTPFQYTPAFMTLHSLHDHFSTSSISFLSQRRYVSSSSPTTPSSSFKVTPTTSTLSKVNGPTSTLPPPLATPERKPGQPFFPAYAFALGKSYATFYKDGIKAIYTNFKASRPVQARLDNRYQGSLVRAVDAGFIDRAKFQLLNRSWFDVKRVPTFALVFLVCGEFTPLVVIAVSGVVPYTCRIPKQIQSNRQTLEKRRAISFRNLTADLPQNTAGVADLERMQLLHISWSLGLSSSMWDWLGGQLPGLPTALLRRNVRRRVEYLELDDELIQRDGGVDEMSIEEVKISLMERGVDILGRNEQQLKGSLKAWLRARDESSILRLLLTRPSVWTQKE